MADNGGDDTDKSRKSSCGGLIVGSTVKLWLALRLPAGMTAGLMSDAH